MNISATPIEQATWLFAQSCNFFYASQKKSELPPISLPEVAFAGRSNVGKSSLVNSLLNRKALARTSNTPGRTQKINFFNLADKMFIVDLPGYGYAKTSKSKITNWENLVILYLLGRSSLKRVFLLLDSRHLPKSSDLEVMDTLDHSAVSYQIVLTKKDQSTQAQIEQYIEHVKSIQPAHPAMHPTVLATSSRLKDGMDELRLEIFNLL